jgi:hypothetical protein
VAYGLGLWAGLVSFDRLRATLRPVTLAVCFVSVPLALSAMAADFSALYAKKMPQSPPAYVGPHLYTVWNVPEPDRIVVMWVMQRFVEPRARFHVIEPFDKVKIGIPFDMPEAATRRHGARSATQFLIDEQRLQSTAKLDSLARMATLTEVTPWMLAADAKAGMLADRVRKAAADHCGKILRSNCLSGLFREIDAWYEEEDT